ncbi:MAG TPA: HAD family hydrolase [Chthonomonadaceae bacterium]|nr:HAD family hydrolase [Chthonomonadaceae bacterium]
MKRAILFDLDGVLINSYEVWRHLVSATAVAFGYPPVSREVFHQTWGQGLRADIERFYPHATLEEVEAYYDAHFLDHLEHLTIFSQAKSVLDRVREAGLATAIVTNTPRPLAEKLLRRAEIDPDVLVGGTDVPNGKPAPDMVLLACEKLGVTPDEALMIGDTVYDRDAARAAGVRFVGLGIPGDDTLERLEDLLLLIESNRER